MKNRHKPSIRGTPTLHYSEPHHDDPPPLTYSRAGTPIVGGFLAAPTSNSSGNINQGSIALRAMRSVRSLARMGSWAQLKNIPLPDENGVAKEKKGEKTKEKKPKGEKGGEKKKKKKKKKKEKAQTVRISSSSYEVGGLTVALKQPRLLDLKRNTASLAWVCLSTIRLLTVRTASTASSNIAPATGRLSVDPATMMGRNRSSSILSSLRPLSLTSTDSRASSTSTVSVRWDKQGLETVKEQRKEEREDRRQSEEKSDRRVSKESRRSSDGRRPRTSLSSIFPSQHATKTKFLFDCNH